MVHTATHTEGPRTASVHTHSEGPLTMQRGYLQREGTRSEGPRSKGHKHSAHRPAACTRDKSVWHQRALEDLDPCRPLGCAWQKIGRRGLERRVDQRKDRKRTRALCRRMTAADVTAAETGLATKKTTTADTKRLYKTSAAAEARRPWR
jgi:hypothetical protein